MMRTLLDVNVLVALLDGQHAGHRAVWDWFEGHAERGWATCPLTQNGLIRIMSCPRYPNPVPVGDLVERLCEATEHRHHQFWADDVSLVDRDRLALARILSPRQITACYLLAIAVSHGGRLATFDGGIEPALVDGARAENLLLLDSA